MSPPAVGRPAEDTRALSAATGHLCCGAPEIVPAGALPRRLPSSSLGGPRNLPRAAAAATAAARLTKAVWTRGYTDRNWRPLWARSMRGTDGEALKARARTACPGNRTSPRDRGRLASKPAGRNGPGLRRVRQGSPRATAARAPRRHGTRHPTATAPTRPRASPTEGRSPLRRPRAMTVTIATTHR
jgi:hypothetical protein